MEESIPGIALVPYLAASRASTRPCHPHRRCGANQARTGLRQGSTSEVQQARYIRRTVFPDNMESVDLQGSARTRL